MAIIKKKYLPCAEVFMLYLQTLDFLSANDVYILSALFVAVWIFGAVYWIKNPYRKQNKKFNLCQFKIVANPKLAWLYVADVPEEYCRQWRAYVNSGAARPSLVFEFVPKKNKIWLLPCFVWCAVVSTCYIVLFALDTSHKEYLVFQAAFWLAFVVVMLVGKILFVKKEKRARQTFGKFVCQLNAIKDISQNDVGVAQRIAEMKKLETSKSTLEKASELLRKSGLESARTVEQQRQINNALNGLLQAYSRKAAKTKM